FILADEMGLGKTVQVLALLASLNHEIENVLIICPTSLIHNWRKEFEKFLPQLNVHIHHGNKRDSSEVKSGIIITSYTTLLNDLHNFKTKGFSLIVADEASYFKNDSTKTFKALGLLRANYKVAVTGTPIENDLSDLWSLMNVVNPNYLGSKESIKEKFGKLKYDDTSSQSLNRRVSPFILRRLKSDVLTELPDKVERVIYCELSRSERSFYNELLISGRDLISNLINSNQSYDTLQVLTLLLRLRQASCDLRLITKSDKKDFISSKMNLLKTIIRNNLQNGSKIIVFSQFVKMLKLIESELVIDGIQSYLLSGSSKIDDRNSMVTNFQDTNNDVMVFLVSLKAGGYGLNLTAADTVVHFDPWWNPAVENQATDRVHRIGQNRVVNCIKLIAANTVEEKILSLQDKKRSLINLAIDEQNPVMSGLSKDDLKFVLE
ncbi:MAG: DEAD/DEAH box helicase, partial [Verrucomicrobiota bacterium]|nr:DEAD/DEAH box helicase [Verrucomicrobiota bacterium]